MKQDNWIAYLLLGLIGYTVALSLIYENEPNLANQINSTVIIGLLIMILLKLKK